MNNASNGEVDSSRIYTRLKSLVFPYLLSVLLPRNDAIVVNGSMRSFDGHHCPALKTFHGIRMLFQNFEVSRFSTLILVLMPFVFAKDGYERKGKVN